LAAAAFPEIGRCSECAGGVGGVNRGVLWATTGEIIIIIIMIKREKISKTSVVI